MCELCCNFENLDNQGECYRQCQIASVGEDISQSYKIENVEAILSASILGTSVMVDGTKIEDYFDDDVRILKYCFARIEEIKSINWFSHTPSAYTCILTFLAFLSQAVANATTQEERHFKDFCNTHLLRLRCKRIERIESGTSPTERTKQNKDGSTKVDVNTWGEVLYKLLRCGLVHSFSSAGNRDPQQNEVEIRLTHDKLVGNEVKVHDFTDPTGAKSVMEAEWKAVTLIVNAFDLIDAIKDSVLHVFTDGTARANIRSYFKSHPPLLLVADNSTK